MRGHRARWGRLAGWGALAATALTAAAFGLVLAGQVLAADPGAQAGTPSGTLTINDGSGFTNSTTVTLHVPATNADYVEIQRNGVSITGRIAYTDTVVDTLPVGDAGYSYRAIWSTVDGVSVWSAQVGITLDQTPPVFNLYEIIDMDQGDDVMPIGLQTDGSALAAIRFSADGTTWSPDIDPGTGYGDIQVDYHLFDPALGGSTMVGPRKVWVKVRDLAGNWSTVRSERFNAAVSAPIKVSPDVPATGHTITLTPQYPAKVTFPTGTHCYWEVMWGDNQSLYYGNRDETFGFFYIYGPSSGGYCKALSFTLPWMQYPRVMIHYRVEPTTDGNAAVDEWVGASPEEPAIVPVIDSTNRHITAASMPLVYVLPDSYTLIAGQSTTYRAYAVGGAKITDRDTWVVDYGDYPLQKQGGTSFTFVPRTTGYLTVCWGTDSTRMTRWSACYDPRVRHPDHYRPNTTPPLQRIAGGGFDGQVPVTLTWNGSDVGWGIAKYQLERSVDGGPWTRVLSRRTRTLTQQLATGHRYRYRVRAIDKAGNRGYWDYGPTFRVRARGDSSTAITYRGAWSAIEDATAAGGAMHESSAAGARAIISFTARDVALVVPRGPALGRMTVYVDGRLLRTIDLSAGSDLPRQILVRRHWRTVGAHRIKLVVEGTADRPAIDLDGFLVLR